MTKLLQNFTAYKIKYVILALFTSALFSCEDDPDVGPPPSVGFDVSFKVAEVGELLSFTNSSTAPDGGSLTYQWDFGDGDLSTNANPTHFYSDTGAYVVKLTATSTMGASEVFEDEVTIGLKYLTSLELLDWADSTFDFTTDAAGEDSVFFRAWDEDGSAPDIVWVLRGPNNQEIFSNAVINPTSPLDLAIEGDFQIFNANYQLFVADEDIITADSTNYDILLGRDGSVNPLVNLGNPNFYVHKVQSGFEETLENGKNPLTGEGGIYIYDPDNPTDLAIALINFEIR